MNPFRTKFVTKLQFWCVLWNPLLILSFLRWPALFCPTLWANGLYEGLIGRKESEQVQYNVNGTDKSVKYNQGLEPAVTCFARHWLALGYELVRTDWKHDFNTNKYRFTSKTTNKNILFKYCYLNLNKNHNYSEKALDIKTISRSLTMKFALIIATEPL